MIVRRSTLFIILTTALVAAAGSALVNAHTRVLAARSSDGRVGRLVAGLGLTDLALFTEANYTRHLSMTDVYTPFQDSPLSFEHFPSGSLFQPPQHLVGTHGPNH